MAKKRLTRSMKDHIFAGVCGGIAEYTHLPSWLIRVLAVVLCFVPFGIIIVPIIYIIFMTKLPFGEQKKKTDPSAIDVEFEVKE